MSVRARVRVRVRVSVRTGERPEMRSIALLYRSRKMRLGSPRRLPMEAIALFWSSGLGLGLGLGLGVGLG